MYKFQFKVSVYVPDFIYRLIVRIVLMDRRFRYGYTFRRIPLTQGKYAIVDPEEYESLSRFKWFAVKYRCSFYAVRTESLKNPRHRRFNVKMHRQIMNLPEGNLVDHINHNGLDNRRTNLRIVSLEQNNWNTRKQAGKCTSQYKGVSKRNGKWRVHLTHKRKRYFLGCFDDEETAARAYDAKAKEVFGEYACLNFKS
jgi:hypothetical protein